MPSVLAKDNIITSLLFDVNRALLENNQSKVVGALAKLGFLYKQEEEKFKQGPVGNSIRDELEEKLTQEFSPIYQLLEIKSKNELKFSINQLKEKLNVLEEQYKEKLKNNKTADELKKKRLEDEFSVELKNMNYQADLEKMEEKELKDEIISYKRIVDKLKKKFFELELENIFNRHLNTEGTQTKLRSNLTHENFDAYFEKHEMLPSLKILDGIEDEIKKNPNQLFYQTLQCGIDIFRKITDLPKGQNSAPEISPDELTKRIQKHEKHFKNLLKKIDLDLVEYKNYLEKEIRKLAMKLPPQILFFYHLIEGPETHFEYKNPNIKLQRSYNQFLDKFIKDKYSIEIDVSKMSPKWNATVVPLEEENKFYELLNQTNTTFEKINADSSPKKNPQLYKALEKLNAVNDMLAALNDVNKTNVDRYVAFLEMEAKSKKTLSEHREEQGFFAFRTKGAKTLDHIDSRIDSFKRRLTK